MDATRDHAKYRPAASMTTVTDDGLGRQPARPAHLQVADLMGNG